MARQIPALVKWIADMKRRADLASAAGTSGDYLYQVATGRRRASADLAEGIERGTSGAISRAAVLWPEAKRRPVRRKVA